ncbi:hypothetical protein BABINDRAFT_9289 [Babjeviella inositovora NRRL Y-12698]|uniref:Arf-GAP domain-containing protein n=1 Tax=Babjeviella inositovora NRRL Y-12698 TaxID=984486 RepID=A0A1E3QLF2_9ASCO|nr:uncharacterized protein BABINDRAFT_9289 [Babjeviella inositovora NRRL Y-12698]ODQ78515.1 hypothetical protein BABINDRAFT_9289 [Babjeviella inositovora NRRL Y-12698]
MSTASRARTHNGRNQAILKQLLKEPANKYCADCKVTKNPRWASWNLGCFMCIRCSGIHRSMGTHISRVKSVDLDSWTDEQINNVVQWGNARANAFWEANLPGAHVPDDSKIENFIRTKYDLKKWAAAKTVPDPASINVAAQAVPAAPPATPPQRAVSTAPSAVPKRPTSQAAGNLLDLDFGSADRPLPSLPAANTSSASVSPASSTASLQSPPPQNSRPDLKKSILSLYSTPTSSQVFQQRPQQLQHALSTSSLAGLSFGQPPTQQYQSPPPQQYQSPPPQQYQDQWANSSSAPQASNVRMDDDLFKNVWG